MSRFKGTPRRESVNADTPTMTANRKTEALILRAVEENLGWRLIDIHTEIEERSRLMGKHLDAIEKRVNDLETIATGDFRHVIGNLYRRIK